MPAPVAVRGSILSWFHAGCIGLVPLSRSSADLYRLLTICTGGIVAENDEHAVELRRVLERPWPAPYVSVAQEVRHAA
jgi:hypothetical protein